MCKVYKLLVVASFSYCQSETWKAHTSLKELTLLQYLQNSDWKLNFHKAIPFLLVNPAKLGSCIYSAALVCSKGKENSTYDSFNSLKKIPLIDF